jgi:hypothetical protein
LKTAQANSSQNKKITKKKRVSGVTQGVEHLPSKPQ